MGYLALFPVICFFALLLSTPLTFDLKKDANTIVSVSGTLLTYQRFISREQTLPENKCEKAKISPASGRPPLKPVMETVRYIGKHTQAAHITVEKPSSALLGFILRFFSAIRGKDRRFRISTFPDGGKGFRFTLTVSVFHLLCASLVFLRATTKNL